MNGAATAAVGEVAPPCAACAGTGKVVKPGASAPTEGDVTVCYECDGGGAAPAAQCRACEGTGLRSCPLHDGNCYHADPCGRCGGSGEG